MGKVAPVEKDGVSMNAEEVLIALALTRLIDHFISIPIQLIMFHINDMKARIEWTRHLKVFFRADSQIIPKLSAGRVGFVLNSSTSLIQGIEGFDLGKLRS